jgi:two-component system chemotaxis sensor kinase CheA
MVYPSPNNLPEEEKAIFLAELDEHLQLLDEDLIRLELGPDPDLLNRIFRSAHTLKGSAATAGLTPMAELAHAMEDVLQGIRKGDTPIDTEVVSKLLEALDRLRALREALTVGAPLPSTDDLVQLLRSWPAGAPPADGDISALDRATIEAFLAEGRPLFKVVARISPESGFVAARQLQLCMEAMARGELVASVPSMDEIEAQRVGNELVMFVATDLSADAFREVLLQVDEVDEIQVQPVHQSGVGAQVPLANQASAAAVARVSGDGAEGRARLGRTVRVDLERLDNLMNLVGELVITRTRLSSIGRRLVREVSSGAATELVDTTNQLARITDELQSEVTRIRMLPVGTIFSKFPRMVRDLALKSGKRVNFIVEGQETELDRSVIEVVGDPLVHLLRNAIDHGIEPAQERLASGKPEEGTIRLAAFQEEGNIFIHIEDDGRGIDPEKVKGAAVAKGLISPEFAARLSTAEALDLVFMPGFSTAQRVTEVSGRGVGMDVVRSNIERVNGSVKLDSQPGRGTKVELKLPLTLAIIRALLVRANGTVFAIPLTAVREVMRIPRQSLNGVGGHPVAQYREGLLPVFDLSGLLEDGYGFELPAGDLQVVVIGLGGRQLGLRVDGLLGNHEIVVKGVEGLAAASACISGATILDDGTVGLILDVGAVLKAALQASLYSSLEEAKC